MNSIYLTPYEETRCLSAEEDYSIGRFVVRDNTMFPTAIGRIARSRHTKLYGMEYQDMDGECSSIWIYNNKLEGLKERLDSKLVECGYVLLTQEQYKKLSILL